MLRIAKLATLLSLTTLLSMAVYVLADVYSQRLIDLAENRYGQGAKILVTHWQRLVTEGQSQKESDKLILANDFFNLRIVFNDDEKIWGTSDYWATPLETMGLAQGDCEDFSIAKYTTLLKMGVPIKKLRLVYVQANYQGRPQAHMVLAYYKNAEAEPLILDNLQLDIRPASERADLVPVFSFNSAGLWIGNDSKPKVNKPETRLSRWRDVLRRMQVEGIQ